MLKILLSDKIYWVILMFAFNTCLVFYLENYIALLFCIKQIQVWIAVMLILQNAAERKVSFKRRATGSRFLGWL